VNLDLADAPREQSFAGLIEVRPEGPYCVSCDKSFRAIGYHLVSKHGFPRGTKRYQRLALLGLPMGARLASDEFIRRGAEHTSWMLRQGILPSTGHAITFRPKHGLAHSARQRAIRPTVAALAACRQARLMIARAAITCDVCGFTFCGRRRGARKGEVSWPRFCSRRCAGFAVGHHDHPRPGRQRAVAARGASAIR